MNNKHKKMFFFLKRVFFIKLPYMQWLPKDKKNEFHDNVDR